MRKCRGQGTLEMLLLTALVSLGLLVATGALLRTVEACLELLVSFIALPLL